jgi:hypothetical protein
MSDTPSDEPRAAFTPTIIHSNRPETVIPEITNALVQKSLTAFRAHPPSVGGSHVDYTEAMRAALTVAFREAHQ